MAEEHHNHHHHHLGDEKSHDECESTVISSTNTDEVEVETQDRGLFGFMGKKEEEKKPEEEVMVTEFEKVHVSEPEPKFEDCKEKEKKHDLLEKLPRSNSSSSSSSDEEEEDENGEKKKKKKKNKGPIEKIKEKISGDKEEEKIEKYEAVVTPLPPKEKYEEEVVVEHGELAQPDEKKGIFEKIKEKLPGHSKKAEEVPPPPPAAEYAAPAAETHSHEAEPKEKKGIFEKIKEKLPGYHSKTEEEKECASPTK